jgi:ABC-type Fe3+-hydroxamate transport system substrate-binding protein
MRLRPLLLLPVLAVAVAACGSSGSANTPNPNATETSPAGDIPDNQAYVRYPPPGAGYSVKVPEGWARTAGGGAVTFTDKLNSIRMEAPSASGARTAPPGAKSVKVATVKRTAGTATEVSYLATSAPDAVTGRTRTNAVERYTFRHNGKAVVLTLTGPKGADNVDPWRIVTDSLRFTR